MNFDEYQSAVQRLAEPADYEHEVIPLLGVGAHVGALMGGQQRYLRDAVVAGTSKTHMGRHLGEVLRWTALVAVHYGLSLNMIALGNLDKIDHRAIKLGRAGLPAFEQADGVDLEGYQALARCTDQEADDGLDPLALSVPILGLAGEAGSLLVALKKQYRERKRRDDWTEFVTTELGDMLWYVSTVATHAGLRVVDIAELDLRRADAARVALSHTLDRASLPVLDAQYPVTERFPRRLLLRFQEGARDGVPEVTMSLVAVEPNAFPDGPLQRGEGKFQGFATGAPLGDKVTDNSAVADAYRYHDAVHLGFLAVMGWSPNLRQLLHLKRKSNAAVDENEDGARAIFAEEGLAALLAKRADDSQGYANPRLVPEDMVEIMTTVLEDLEVARMPPWLWRVAISQGFTAMRCLQEGRGGYLIADLDDRSLTYTKVPPRWLGGAAVEGVA